MDTFFFTDTATTQIYTLSLHDALPICGREEPQERGDDRRREDRQRRAVGDAEVRGQPGIPRREQGRQRQDRSEEHTSELQSQSNLVCRLLLEKKKKTITIIPYLYHLVL